MMKVYRKTKERFKVSSEFQRGRYYQVENPAPGVWSCGCPHFQNRDYVTDCKHIRKVREALENRDFEDDEIQTIQTEILNMHSELGRLTTRLSELEEEGLVCRKVAVKRKANKPLWIIPNGR